MRADILDEKRPCLFITICNFREQIEILPPPDCENVFYGFLAQFVGEYILLTAPDVDISVALSMIPLITTDHL
jgi:hypothetical protein